MVRKVWVREWEREQWWRKFSNKAEWVECEQTRKQELLYKLAFHMHKSVTQKVPPHTLTLLHYECICGKEVVAAWREKFSFRNPLWNMLFNCSIRNIMHKLLYSMLFLAMIERKWEAMRLLSSDFIVKWKEERKGVMALVLIF